VKPRTREIRAFERSERRAIWKRRGRIALRVIAGAWLGCVALDGAGCNGPSQILPRPVAFFTQVSVLFPRAAHATIDYRAEAWVCSKQAWVEYDTRPYFPIDPDDKENRFNRAMHFFRENRETMHALDRYLVRSHDDRPGPDGIDAGERIGGVRLMSLRIPIPPVGSSFERYEREPLSHYPEKERKYFYHTPESLRERRCGSQIEEHE